MNELIKKGNIVKITMSGGKILYGGILDNSHSYIKFLNKNGTLNNVLINGIETIEEYDLIEEDDILFDEYFKLYQERENLRDMIEEIAKMLFEKNNLLNQQKAKMVEYVRNKNIEKVKKQQEEINKKEQTIVENVGVSKDNLVKETLTKIVEIEEQKTEQIVDEIFSQNIEETKLEVSSEDKNDILENNMFVEEELFFDENND